MANQQEATPKNQSTSTNRRRGRPGHDVESVIKASVEVFNDKGFDGTSMDELSQHLGISKSAIYHHVASKNELLEIALTRALDGLAEAVEVARALDASPAERLECLLRSSITVLIERRPFVTLLLRVRGNSDVERQALERRKIFDRYLADLVTEAAESGVVRSDLDPVVTSRLLFGMVNSLTEWLRPHHNPDQIADTVCAIAFQGICSTAAAHQPAR